LYLNEYGIENNEYSTAEYRITKWHLKFEKRDKKKYGRWSRKM